MRALPRNRNNNCPDRVDDIPEIGSLDELDYLSPMYRSISPTYIYLGLFFCFCSIGLVNAVDPYLDMDAKSYGATRFGLVKMAKVYANELRAACYFSQEVVSLELLNAGLNMHALKQPKKMSSLQLRYQVHRMNGSFTNFLN